MGDREYGTGEGAEPVQSGDSLFLRQPAAAGTTIIKDADVDEMKTFYKGETKVLWTGPLSVVGVPTSLDGGEAFSDWDLISWEFSLTSDTQITTSQQTFVETIGLTNAAKAVFSDSGRIIFSTLSDTSFQIDSSTLGAKNISRVIGISL